MSSVDTAQADVDVLAGIDPKKTTKKELLDRLDQAAGIIFGFRRQKVTQLQELEASIRAKHAAHQRDPLMQIIVQGTDAELREAIEFLHDFDDLLPATLERLVAGSRVLLGLVDSGQTEHAQIPPDQPTAATPPKS